MSEELQRGGVTISSSSSHKSLSSLNSRNKKHNQVDPKQHLLLAIIKIMSDEKNTDPVGLELEEVRMEEAAKDTTVEEKPDDATALTKENYVNETEMPLFIVFYASIVLMIATGTNYEWNITVRQVLYHLCFYSYAVLSSALHIMMLSYRT
jgi:hypothetical protein